jgi:acetyl esterase
MAAPYAAADGLVRVYPAREPNGSGLVWAHGGGFTGGDLDMPEADAVARALAARGTTVVSVDYRLVGDGCRYPAPSDDILAAWSWAASHADRLRVDVDRLAIGGASAGANLVTGAVLRMLHTGVVVLPAVVLLAYPTLHAVQAAPDAELRSALDADPDADRFGPDAVRDMYEQYLGGSVDEAPLYAVPGTATTADLAGFPPTVMVNGEVDELRVSGEAFAAALATAGVPVEVTTEPDTRHGHLNEPGGSAASASIDRFAAHLAAPSRGSRPAFSAAASGTPTPWS